MRLLRSGRGCSGRRNERQGRGAVRRWERPDAGGADVGRGGSGWNGHWRAKRPAPHPVFLLNRDGVLVGHLPRRVVSGRHLPRLECQMAGGGWRMLERMAECSALFAALFLPVLFGMKELFVWTRSGLPASMARLLEEKRFYLNVPFFIARAAVYFAIWIAVSWALSGWSRRQDESEDLRLSVKQRRLGSAAVPILGLSLTFAAF